MILNENYGNLNILDKSFLYYITYDDNSNVWNPKKIYKNMNLKNSMISPESKVEVDPVRPHSMKHLIEILDKPDVAFIVFRINRKQLCLISSNNNLYDREFSGKIIVKPSILYTNLLQSDSTSDAIPRSFDNDLSLKKFLSKIYNEYPKYFGANTKPVWDIIVVYKDFNVAQKWKERDEAKKGYIPTPKEKEAYTDFILDYKNTWKQKCINYVNEHMKDNQNSNEIKQELLSKTSIKKFKFKGDFYNLNNCPRVNFDSDDSYYLKYISSNMDNPIRVILIEFKMKGFKPNIISVKYCDINSSDINDYQPLF